jgi:protein phosphatase
MIIIESAGITDVGKKRKANEDALFLDDALGLYVVADGMGGHRAGEIASQLVVKNISEYIQQSQQNGDTGENIDPDRSLSPEANRLLSGIRQSNKAVHSASLNDDACRGMGSTVSAVYFTDHTFIAANVGDSPIYLIRDGKIKLLSVLHTVLAEQAAMNPERAGKLGIEFKHVLTRAMGTDESVKADIYEIQCFKDDILVISSDGLSDKASPGEILKLVNQNELDAVCQRLVKLANDRGGDDNVTAIVLKVKAIKKGRFNPSRLKAIAGRYLGRYFSSGISKQLED